MISRKIKLPAEVAEIYRAVQALERRYPRKFTPDGHLVGSIGEVVAAEELGLTLYRQSHPGHDAHDSNGDVQIKTTGGNSGVAMYGECTRLLVLRIVSPTEAEIVYYGPGDAAWRCAGKQGKNGQRVVSLTKLRLLAKEQQGSESTYARMAEEQEWNRRPHAASGCGDTT